MGNQGGAHPDMLCAIHVIPRTIADEDCLLWREIKGAEYVREGIKMRLCDRDFARVDRGVEELV